MDRKFARLRVTLDGQLVDYWAREAMRLDAMAEQARFGWQKRRLARKADNARAQAERSRIREADRRVPIGMGAGLARTESAGSSGVVAPSAGLELSQG